MGYTSYSDDSRRHRSVSLNYASLVSEDRGVAAAAMNDIFKQTVERKVHELMSPKGLKVRECRDSEAHPNTVPIVFGLDLTGSMGHIPKQLCVEGLPTMMSTIIQRGVPDASLCFLGVGDHECDRGPIQVGQFESGDAELDMWLTRLWLEGGGGPNAGESYSLAWYTAVKHMVTDACEKRNTKGFLFTAGDEPCLAVIPVSALKAFFGDAEPVQSSVKIEEILEEAKKCWNVFHIGLGKSGEGQWRDLLGQNYIQIDRDDYAKIPSIIAETIVNFRPGAPMAIKATDTPAAESTGIML